MSWPRAWRSHTCTVRLVARAKRRRDLQSGKYALSTMHSTLEQVSVRSCAGAYEDDTHLFLVQELCTGDTAVCAVDHGKALYAS